METRIDPTRWSKFKDKDPEPGTWILFRDHEDGLGIGLVIPTWGGEILISHNSPGVIGLLVDWCCGSPIYRGQENENAVLNGISVGGAIVFLFELEESDPLFSCSRTDDVGTAKEKQNLLGIEKELEGDGTG